LGKLRGSFAKIPRLTGLTRLRSNLDRRIEIGRLGFDTSSRSNLGRWFWIWRLRSEGADGGGARRRRRAERRRAAARSPDFAENGRPGLELERGLHEEHERDAANPIRGSGRGTEAAEDSHGDERRR